MVVVTATQIRFQGLDGGSRRCDIMAGPRPNTTAFCVGRIMGRALQRGTPLEVPGLPALTYRLSAVQRVGLRAVTRAKDRLADRFGP